MTTITRKGNLINTYSDLPEKGTMAPDFNLTKTDLKDISLADFHGKKIILNIFPSVDTSVCAASMRKFNEKAKELENTVVISVSKDLPFAHERFAKMNGIDEIIAASELRQDEFGKNYGVLITDGPRKGLFSRAVVVIDENGKIIYTQQVAEMTNEPDYRAALKALNNS